MEYAQLAEIIQRGDDISREEIQRIYQQGGLIHGDAIPVHGLTADDIDPLYFTDFLQKQYDEALIISDLALTLTSMNLMKAGALNVAGALLFARNPEFRLPVFGVKAISFPGVDRSEFEL